MSDRVTPVVLGRVQISDPHVYPRVREHTPQRLLDPALQDFHRWPRNERAELVIGLGTGVVSW